MRTIIRITLLSLLPFLAFAQDDLKMQPQQILSFKDRLVYGGNFALSFGDVVAIEVSPSIGYKINENLLAGIGLAYTYFNFKEVQYKTSLIGGRIFARYQLFQGALAYSEVEQLSLTVPYNDNVNRTTAVTNIWVGAGYRSNWGQRLGTTIMLLYNLNQPSSFGIYPNPTLRIGVEF